MFKAEGINIELQLEKGMAVKTVGWAFLQGQSAELFRAAFKSQAMRDRYERRLIGFLKRMNARSPDAFFEFAKCNPALAENSGLQ
jgi:hypothetical protein